MKTVWRELPRDEISPQYAGLYVTLNPKGIFKMNRVAYQRMGEPEAVNVLFDPANSRIGLKPTSRAGRNAYATAPRGPHGGRIVRAYRIITEYALDLPSTVRFYDAEIDPDGILILDLRTARIPPSVTNHYRHKDWDYTKRKSYGSRGAEYSNT
jgi:hypothetical protein